MRICHVTPRYHPAISGAEFYLQRVSEQLVLEQEVRVHCTNALDFAALHSSKGKLVPPGTWQSIINRVPVTRHPVVHDPVTVMMERETITGKFRGAGLDDVPAAFLDPGPLSPSMRDALVRERPDVFHVTCYPYLNVHYTLLAANHLEVPCVLTPFMHPENPRYDPSCMRVLDGFTRILACTPSEKTFLIKAGIRPAAIERVTMGVDVGPFQGADPAPFFRATGVHPGDPVFLFCGYKNHEKGAITLLRAVPALAEAIPRCKLVMIGPSTRQYNQELHKLGPHRGHVININPASLSGYFDPIKLGAFAACTVYAMPSRSDAFGIAFLEAWAAGKPVIAADIPAMRDLFVQGKGGFHVPFGDPGALAKELARLHGDPDACKAAGDEGHAKIHEEGLTWERVAARVNDIYARIT